MTESTFIHRYVPPHPGNDRTLLLLHGTGGNEDSLLGLGQAIAPGAGLLSPRGKVLEGSMPRFFRRFGEGNLDIEDLKFRTDELAEFLQTAAEQYGFDPKKVSAAGYSNGANVATTLLYRHPEMLEGAAIFHGMLPYIPDPAPDLTGKRLLLTGGNYDPLIPAQETAQLADLLAGMGAEVETVWHQGGHELASSEVAAAQRWFAGSG